MTAVIDQDRDSGCTAAGGDEVEPRDEQAQRGEVSPKEMAVTTVAGFVGAAAILHWLIPICLSC